MQTKKQSLTEAITNTAVGFGISYVSTFLIFPIVGVQTSPGTNLIIVIYFTIISILRGYVLRRAFNKKTDKRMRYPNAKELKHCLNETKDTLLLESDYRIDRIQLDSKNHNKHIVVNLNTMQIPIDHLPTGRTNVMVTTNRKIIVFSIIKNQLKTNSK